MNGTTQAQAVVIHDMAGAAERAKVTEAVILRWIQEGLRAVQVNRTVGRRGPRDYRIFDSWLVEFLEARAVQASRGPEPSGPARPAPPGGRARRGRPPGKGKPNRLGPCPA